MLICQSILRGPSPFPRGYVEFPTTLGEHIRKRRIDLGISQAALADRIGVGQWTLLNWDQDRNAQTVRHLPALWDFLGL